MEYVYCLISKDGKILLTKDTASRKWTLPGTPVSDELDPEAAATTTTAEQIGASVSVLQEFGVYEDEENTYIVLECVLGNVFTETASAKFFSKEAAQGEQISQIVKDVLETL